MFENILQLVKENAGEAIINNNAIPNEKNDLACETTAHSIFDSLKGMISGGDVSKITDLFSGSSSADKSAQVNQISSDVKGSLMQKFNLDNSSAGNIVQSLIPKVMSMLSSKTNDPNDKSIDMQSIISSLTGGGSQSQGSGIINAVKNLFGGNK